MLQVAAAAFTVIPARRRDSPGRGRDDLEAFCLGIAVTDTSDAHTCDFIGQGVVHEHDEAGHAGDALPPEGEIFDLKRDLVPLADRRRLSRHAPALVSHRRGGTVRNPQARGAPPGAARSGCPAREGDLYSLRMITR